MAGKGGKRQGAGRKKGVPNKITKTVREAIINAFFAGGGEAYLRRLMTSDPKAFCTLLGKTMPTVVAGDAENPVALRMLIDRPPEETREQWLARRSMELPPLWGPQPGPQTDAITAKWCQELFLRRGRATNCKNWKRARDLPDLQVEDDLLRSDNS